MSSPLFSSRPTADNRPGSPPSRVLTGLVVCLVVTGLLSSQRLVEMAERQQFGSARDRWLAMAEVVDDAASGAGLDRPAALIDDALDRDDAPSEVVLGDLTTKSALVDDEVSAPTSTTTAGSSPTTATTTPTTTVEAQPTTSTTEAAPITSSAPTSTEPPVLGEATTDSPLLIWVGGDSLGEYVGSELLYKVADPAISDVELDFAISTGLARPDYFDWPGRLSEVMQRDERPHVVIFMVGGNDDQDMLVDGERVSTGSDEWRAEYRTRVGTMMDIAAYDRVQMLWINLPPMRDDRREGIAVDMNEALWAEAGARPWVEIVDIVDLFTGPDGGYDQFITEPSGDDTRRARADDGVHLTRIASRWVAELVWSAVGERWTLEASPPG